MRDINKLVEGVDGGVCQSIDDLVRAEFECELEDLTKEEMDAIDEAIFNCGGCGWTMPVDDQDEDDDQGRCRECVEDEDEG